MKPSIENSDGIRKKLIVRDEDGEKIASLKMTVEFGELLSDGQVEKIADFLDMTGKNFVEWMN